MSLRPKIAQGRLEKERREKWGFGAKKRVERNEVVKRAERNEVAKRAEREGEKRPTPNRERRDMDHHFLLRFLFICIHFDLHGPRLCLTLPNSSLHERNQIAISYFDTREAFTLSWMTKNEPKKTSFGRFDFGCSIVHF